MMKLVLFMLLLHTSLVPQASNISALHSGELLRMHVIAADDTAPMQALKLQVRDKVQQAYAEHAAYTHTMMENVVMLLPQLQEAAETSIAQADESLPVTTAVEYTHFGFRLLDGQLIPPGDYPALMIRIGDAQGHNWWGLVDPEISLSAACISDTAYNTQPFLLDWSFSSIIKLLCSIIHPAGGCS